MYVKVTSSGGRQYFQIVKGYREEGTGKVKHRTIGTLGRVDQLESADMDKLVNSLLRRTGRADLKSLTAGIDSNSTTFNPDLDLGDLWLVTLIWKELGFAKTIIRAMRLARHQIDVEKLVRTMVLNRLSDPASKLGVLRWLETVYLPGIDRSEIKHHHLLRAMDALIEHKDRLEAQIAGKLLPLFDDQVEVLFYDITTINVESDHQVSGDLRRYGKSKDHSGTARQFAVGVVQTADGLPITHEVFEGNVSEPKTLQGVVKRLTERFPIRRLVLVADRGLLSTDNLHTLQCLSLPNGSPVEYILAVPARRYSRKMAVVSELHPVLARNSREQGGEVVMESKTPEGERVVIAHDQTRAKEARRRRNEQLRKAIDEFSRLEERLTDHQMGTKLPGRKLTENGALVRFKQFIGERRLSRFFHVDLDSDQFNGELNRKALRQAWRHDGKLVLITNLPKDKHPAAEVVERYKGLADIERGFRVLKSDIEIAPVHHRLPDRIRAHTFICFLALVIHRVMRMRLRQAENHTSPTRALEELSRIKLHKVTLATGKVLQGVTTITPEQSDLFAALKVRKPTTKAVNRQLLS